MPVERRALSVTLGAPKSSWERSSSGLGRRGYTVSPALVMRKVWSPGRSLRPRTFTTRIFRTTEFRSTCWLRTMMPSATV